MMLPENPGMYIVETRKSSGNHQRLDCHWNGKHWSCSNQVVLRWLKEN